MTLHCRPARVLPCLLAVLGIGASAAGQALAPDEPQVIWRRWWSAYNRADYVSAVEISHQLLAIEPHSPIHEYNLACVLALQGRREDAFRWVREAAGHGFSNDELFRNDADLQSLRGDARFQELLALVVENRKRLGVRFDPRLIGKPLIIAPPPDEDEAPYPVVIALHGYGGTAEAFADVWRDIVTRRRVLLVLPRALEPARGGGFSWGTVDSAEMIVEEALAHAAQRYRVDAERVVLAGFSQGGFMAYNVGMRLADRLRGVVPVAGRYDPALASPPDVPTGRMPRFVLIVGSEDYTLAANRKAAAELAAAGLHAKLEVIDGLGHALPPRPADVLSAALDFIFNGGPADRDGSPSGGP